MKTLTCLAVVALSLIGTIARAAAPEPALVPTPVSVPAPTDDDSYRGQIAAADLGASGLLVMAYLAQGPNGRDTGLSDLSAMVGSSGLFLGGPTVHAVHGQWGRAGVSLALRMALPLAFAYVGGHSATCAPNEWFCGLDEALLGGAIGLATASAIDIALLAGPATHEGPAPTRQPWVSPRVALTPNMASIGLGGQF